MIGLLKSQFKPVHQVAVPMVLSAISIPMLGIVDTAILGRLDSEIYLGAVNVGSSGLNMLLWGLGFLRMSTTGLAAQAHGASQDEQLGLILTRGMAVACLLGLALLLLQPVLIPLQLWVLSNGGSVAVLAEQYMQIRYLALPMSLLLFVMNGYFLAVGQAGKVLALMLTSQLSNMVLDYVLVMHFDMAVAGVAWGSLISETLAMMLGLYWLLGSSATQSSQWRQLLNDRWSVWAAYFSLNRDIFIRTLCLIAVFVMMTKQSAVQGDLVLAANAVLMNFFYLTTYGLDGYAHAVESICGRQMGKGDAKGIRDSLQASLVFSLLMALAFVLCFGVWGQTIIALLTDLPDVVAMANQYLPWLVVLPLLSMHSFIYDGFCIGTTQTRVMRQAMLVSVLLAFIPLLWLLWHFFPDSKNHMLWLSFTVFFVVRGLSMYWMSDGYNELILHRTA